jgi:PAS domain S-box-containing protein
MREDIADGLPGTPPRRTAVRYLGAVLAVAVGVGLAWWLQPVLDPSVLLLMAVLVAAWFSGFWPAMFASVLATLAIDYFFTLPRYTINVELAHVPRLIVFTLVAGLFASVSAARRRAEQSLRQAHDELDAKVRERTAELTTTHAAAVAARRRFQELVNSIDGVIWEADARTLRRTFVSDQALRLLGYPVQRWLDEPAFWRDHLHPDDRDSVFDRCASSARALEDHDVEYRMVASDGRAVWVRDLVNVLAENGQPVCLRGVMLDVTDRKRAEQELEELAGRLIHAQEQERSRIGRELHDHISQMLGVLTIRLDQLRAEETTPASIGEALEEMRAHTSELTDDIHGLSHRLHSSALDYLGLVPALHKLVNEVAGRHGIQVTFSHEAIPSPLPSTVALALFRVAEESLTNVIKHSQATSADVRVAGAADGITLSIRDDGRGFAPSALDRGAGLGFVSMRERLRVLRGTVRVDSAPGQGTTIEVRVPAASMTAAASHDAGAPDAAAASNPGAV